MIFLTPILYHLVGESDGGIHGRLQPDQYLQDEAGALHGCHWACVPYWPHPAPAPGQCPAAWSWWERTPVTHQAGLIYVRFPHFVQLYKTCRNPSMVFEVSCSLVLIVRLFIFRSEYECFQIELAKNYGQTEWREDIKSIMLKAGLQNQQITFLFVDTQVNSSILLSPATVYFMYVVVNSIITTHSYYILYWEYAVGILLYCWHLF